MTPISRAALLMTLRHALHRTWPTYLYEYTCAYDPVGDEVMPCIPSSLLYLPFLTYLPNENYLYRKPREALTMFTPKRKGSSKSNSENESENEKE